MPTNKAVKSRRNWYAIQSAIDCGAVPNYMFYRDNYDGSLFAVIEIGADLARWGVR